MDGSSALYKYIKRNHDAKISPGLKLYAHNGTSAMDEMSLIINER
jgi:hypothetical protein